MGKFESSEVEREAVRTVAAMMAVSARTAPKARGIDDVKTMVIDGDDLELYVHFWKLGETVQLTDNDDYDSDPAWGWNW